MLIVNIWPRKCSRENVFELSHLQNPRFNPTQARKPMIMCMHVRMLAYDEDNNGVDKDSSEQ